jgi:hypothetical protein
MIGITPAQLLDYEEDVRVALDREESRFREGIGGGDGQ